MNLAKKHENIGAHLSDSEEKLKQIGDSGRVELVRSFRSGIVAAGLSENSIQHLSTNEAQVGQGKIALGQFNTQTKKISLAGLEELTSSAKQKGIQVHHFVRDVLIHEKRHKESAEAIGAKRFNEITAYLFGTKAIHNIEEAMASAATPWDTYNQERGMTRQYAQKLGMNYEELIEAKRTGSYQIIIDKALENELLFVDPNDQQMKKAA